jgi:MarR family transcriptional regulator, lower aerobic nicotinate degradation pathway regulator
MSSELPPSIAERIGFLTARLHQAVLKLGHEAGAFEDPLTGKHLGCLTVLIDEGPLSQQELGRRACIDRTSVVAVVDDLERAGFVERRRNPDDRRAYALHATRAGRSWQLRATKAVLEAEDELLAPLDAEERRQLIDLMQRVLVGEPAKLVADAPVEVRAR